VLALLVQMAAAQRQATQEPAYLTRLVTGAAADLTATTDLMAVAAAGAARVYIQMAAAIPLVGLAAAAGLGFMGKVLAALAALPGLFQVPLRLAAGAAKAVLRLPQVQTMGKVAALAASVFPVKAALAVRRAAGAVWVATLLMIPQQLQMAAPAAQAQSALSGPATRAYSPAPIQDKYNDHVH
jgi:hypothetical protein